MQKKDMKCDINFFFKTIVFKVKKLSAIYSNQNIGSFFPAFECNKFCSYPGKIIQINDKLKTTVKDKCKKF